MTTLIDADGIPYIVSYKFKDYLDNENAFYINEVQKSTDNFIKNMLEKVKAKEYIGVLSNGEKTFRHEIALHRPYKGQRTYDQTENGYHVWSKVIKDRMKSEWGFELVPTGSKLETDDVISITAYRMKNDYPILICSADKDLLQIPVKHFNFTNWNKPIVEATDLGYLETTKSGKEIKYFGTGFKFLMFQMVIGDTIDNIMGVKGKGPAYAYKILKDCTSKLECVKAVLKVYIDWVDSYYGKKLYREMYQLLKLLEEHENVPNYIPIKL